MSKWDEALDELAVARAVARETGEPVVAARQLPKYDEPFKDCTCSMVLRDYERARPCPIHDTRDPPAWTPADEAAMEERDNLERVRQAAQKEEDDHERGKDGTG
jgi:hypothetical protein